MTTIFALEHSASYACVTSLTLTHGRTLTQLPSPIDLRDATIKR